MANISYFSVLMSVYNEDNPTYLNAALESIYNQTLFPSEFILVQDGPVTSEIEKILSVWSKKFGPCMKTVVLTSNVGLGEALNRGLAECSNDIVVRMDSDDISLPERCERQVQYLIDNPDYALVNTWVSVFSDNPNHILYQRKIPITHEDICKLVKFRSPVNHPSVAFRKSRVIAAGGYPNWRKSQDYPLWASMIHKGMKLSGQTQVLCLHRVNLNTAVKRQGMEALRYQLKMQKKLLTLKLISMPRFLFNVILRSTACLIPSKLAHILRTKMGY